MNRSPRTGLVRAVALMLVLGSSLAPSGGVHAADRPLAHVVIGADASAPRSTYDGTVEAVRQTAIAAQVSGVIVALDVKAGDAVKAGQTLAHIDARAAEQTTAASEAQVSAARAALEVATRDLERQRQLYQKRYISEAALDRAEAQFKSTQAQVNAQIAQANASRTQTGFFIVRAPYTGIVTDVPVALGDMAMPGRPLATIYDPSALRVAVAVPQSAMPAALGAKGAVIELASNRQGAPAPIVPTRVTVLPTVDASSHTVTVRMDLPAGLDAKPGAFARVSLPAPSVAATGRIAVPLAAVVRRTELNAVYVLDSADRPLLRQVRLGRVSGDEVEVLAGVSPGDRVVTTPQAAARRAQ